MGKEILNSALLKVVYSTCDYDDREAARFSLEGMDSLSFLDGEVEDNSLQRNFSDTYNIDEVIEYANQLGLDGTKIVIDRETINWEDF